MIAAFADAKKHPKKRDYEGRLYLFNTKWLSKKQSKLAISKKTIKLGCGNLEIICAIRCFFEGGLSVCQDKGSENTK